MLLNNHTFDTNQNTDKPLVTFRIYAKTFHRLHTNFFFFYGDKVRALKCYQCDSEESWADCDEKEITCSPWQSRCAKFFYKDETDFFYAKGCLTEKECQDGPSKFERCRKAEERGLKVTCDLLCCSDDRCNGANDVSKVSGIIFMVCALLGLLAVLVWMRHITGYLP